MADHSGAVLHWPTAFIAWWTEELAGFLPDHTHLRRLRITDGLIKLNSISRLQE